MENLNKLAKAYKDNLKKMIKELYRKKMELKGERGKFTAFRKEFAKKFNLCDEWLRKHLEDYEFFVIKLKVPEETFFSIGRLRWHLIKPYATEKNLSKLIKLITTLPYRKVRKKLRTLKQEGCAHTFELVKFCPRCKKIFRLSPEEVERIRKGFPL